MIFFILLSVKFAARFLFEHEQMNDLLAHFVRERVPDRIVHAKGGKSAILSQ